MAKRAKKRKSSAPPDARATTASPRKIIPAPARPPGHAEGILILRAAIIVALGLFIYWPALTGDWLWDDRDLIADNALIHDPNGLWKIWFQPAVMFDFLPLKISVEWIEWRLFGEDTLGYHLVSLGLHLTSAFLLWRFFLRLGLRYAWLGALIFVVHPVQVESVAWIAELKNTLSMPFFLLAMTAWVDYDAHRKTRDYLLALVFFLLAMLTKPTMAMFPLVILLYAWWRRARITPKDLQASAPFFVISLCVGSATALFLARTPGEQHVILGGIFSRLACAGLSLAFYFSKCVLPIHLMTAYPQWPVDPPSPLQFLPWPILAGILYFLWTKRATWGRHALLGLGFFLLNLAPFLGLNAASYMTYTWVMDHLLYIPMLGLIGLAVASADHIGAQLSPFARRIGATAIVGVLALMAWSSQGYAAFYTSLVTLWSHNISENFGAALPHNDLGVAFARAGLNDAALDQFRIAAQLDSRYIDAHHNFALELLKTGHPAEALPEFETTLQLAPNLAESHYGVALVLDQLGRIAEAIPEYQRAISLDPHYIDAYQNLAASLASLKRYDDALQIVQAGLRFNPSNPQLQDDLAKLTRMQQQGSPQAGGLPEP